MPSTQFDEFQDMIRLESVPGAVQRHTGDAVSIAYNRDRNQEPEEVRISSRLSGQSSHNGAADDATTAEDLDQTASRTDAATGRLAEIEEDSVETTDVEIVLQSGLELTLYELASLLRVTELAHGNEIQRVKTVLERTKQPFPGAGTILRGDETLSYDGALHAALVLDATIHPSMTNRIDALADAGFETLQPDAQSQSNYEYERLFRVARDAISDGLAQNTSRDELVDIVSGDVMKAAARNENPEYGEEEWKREAAEKFAAIFVDDVFHGMCDGDFYELRRHENHLASGYNAAIRRRLQQFFDEHNK